MYLALIARFQHIFWTMVLDVANCIVILYQSQVRSLNILENPEILTFILMFPFSAQFGSQALLACVFYWRHFYLGNFYQRFYRDENCQSNMAATSATTRRLLSVDFEVFGKVQGGQVMEFVK